MRHEVKGRPITVGKTSFSPSHNPKGQMGHPGKRSVVQNPPRQISRLGSDSFASTNPSKKIRME